MAPNQCVAAVWGDRDVPRRLGQGVRRHRHVSIHGRPQTGIQGDDGEAGLGDEEGLSIVFADEDSRGSVADG